MPETRASFIVLMPVAAGAGCCDFIFLYCFNGLHEKWPGTTFRWPACRPALRAPRGAVLKSRRFSGAGMRPRQSKRDPPWARIVFSPRSRAARNITRNR